MKDLIQKRKQLLIRFEQSSDFVRGSINSVCAKCKRAGCICERQTSRRAYRLTYKDSQQRTRIVYVPRDRLPEIKKKIANYSKSRRIVEEIIETNLEIFKSKAGR
jgi:hypothetical protein